MFSERKPLELNAGWAKTQLDLLNNSPTLNFFAIKKFTRLLEYIFDLTGGKPVEKKIEMVQQDYALIKNKLISLLPRAIASIATLKEKHSKKLIIIQKLSAMEAKISQLYNANDETFNFPSDPPYHKESKEDPLARHKKRA